MPQVLVPADPVKVTRAWLLGKYPWPVTITKNRPNPTVGRVVAVRRSGGIRPTAVTDAAWLSAECFAPSDEQAADLGHHTWGLLFAMAGQVIDGVQCYRVQELGGPSDMPAVDADAPSSAHPRFVMSVQAHFRARSV